MLEDQDFNGRVHHNNLWWLARRAHIPLIKNTRFWNKYTDPLPRASSCDVVVSWLEILKPQNEILRTSYALGQRKRLLLALGVDRYRISFWRGCVCMYQFSNFCYGHLPRFFASNWIGLQVWSPVHPWLRQSHTSKCIFLILHTAHTRLYIVRAVQHAFSPCPTRYLPRLIIQPCFQSCSMNQDNSPRKKRWGWLKKIG